MKIRKTIIFMIQNSSPLFLYFLICWLIFSAIGTISDDPFQYGTIPDAMEEIENWSTALPWSVWKIFKAITLIIEEIVRDISYQRFWLVIIPTLMIGFLIARYSLRGIENERKIWMNWHNSMAEENISDIGNRLSNRPESSNYIYANLKDIPLHVLYWTGFFIMVTVIFGFERHIYNPYFGFSQTMLELGSIYTNFLIPTILLTVLSSFYASRGYVKGIFVERESWLDWYKHNQQSHYKDLDDPPSQSETVESFFSAVIKTIIFTLQNPTHMYKQFLVWVIVIPILLFLLCIGIWGVPNSSSIPDLTNLFLTFTIPLSIIAYIMSYREAKGKINGIRSEQSFWSNWYENKQNKTDYPVTDVNNLDTSSDNTFLYTIKLTLELMLEKTLRIVYYILGWTVCFVLAYGITDKLFLEGFSDSIQILLIFCLAIISYYFETKGFLIGCMNQRRYWIDWLNQKPERGNNDTDSPITPGILEVC